MDQQVVVARRRGRAGAPRARRAMAREAGPIGRRGPSAGRAAGCARRCRRARSAPAPSRFRSLIRSPRSRARSIAARRGSSGSTSSSAARQRSSKRRSAASCVVHLEVRVDARLGAERAQQRLAEGVDRRELGAVEAVARARMQRRAPPRGRSGAPRCARRARSRTRSRSSAAALSVNVIAAIRSTAWPASDQRHDAVDQRPRLAGARAGLDEHRGVEVLGDRPPGLVVGAHVAPPRSAAASPRPPRDPTPASARLAVEVVAAAARADAGEVAAAAVLELGVEVVPLARDRGERAGRDPPRMARHGSVEAAEVPGVGRRRACLKPPRALMNQ